MAEHDEPDVPNARAHATAERSDNQASSTHHIPHPRPPEPSAPRDGGPNGAGQVRAADPAEGRPADDPSPYADLTVRSALESATMELPFLVESLAAATRRARAAMESGADGEAEILADIGGLATPPAETPPTSASHTDTATHSAPSTGEISFRATAAVPGTAAPTAAASDTATTTRSEPAREGSPGVSEPATTVMGDAQTGPEGSRFRRLVRRYGWLIAVLVVVAVAIAGFLALSSPSSDGDAGAHPPPSSSPVAAQPSASAPAENATPHLPPSDEAVPSPGASPNTGGGAPSPASMGPAPAQKPAPPETPAAPAAGPPPPATPAPPSDNAGPKPAPPPRPRRPLGPPIGPWNADDRRATLDAYCEAVKPSAHADDVSRLTCKDSTGKVFSVNLDDVCAHRFGTAYGSFVPGGDWYCFRG